MNPMNNNVFYTMLSTHNPVFEQGEMPTSLMKFLGGEEEVSSKVHQHVIRCLAVFEKDKQARSVFVTGHNGGPLQGLKEEELPCNQIAAQLYRAFASAVACGERLPGIAFGGNLLGYVETHRGESLGPARIEQEIRHLPKGVLDQLRTSHGVSVVMSPIYCPVSKNMSLKLPPPPNSGLEMLSGLKATLPPIID